MFRHLEDDQDAEEKAAIASGDRLEAANEDLRRELQVLRSWSPVINGGMSMFEANVGEQAFPWGTEQGNPIGDFWEEMGFGLQA